jgi:hypothetical protein
MGCGYPRSSMMQYIEQQLKHTQTLINRRNLHEHHNHTSFSYKQSQLKIPISSLIQTTMFLSIHSTQFPSRKYPYTHQHPPASNPPVQCV